jgi:hypothetical protein
MEGSDRKKLFLERQSISENRRRSDRSVHLYVSQNHRFLYSRMNTCTHYWLGMGLLLMNGFFTMLAIPQLRDVNNEEKSKSGRSKVFLNLDGFSKPLSYIDLFQCKSM